SVPKLEAAGALARLLPNLGGPNYSCQRLYTGVMFPVAVYGALGRITSRPATSQYCVDRRAMTVRVIKGYRMISSEVASLLAGSAPWDLEAKTRASIH
ncbi:jg19804, partial [Pararge aegeria aegeria]